MTYLSKEMSYYKITILIKKNRLSSMRHMKWLEVCKELKMVFNTGWQRGIGVMWKLYNPQLLVNQNQMWFAKFFFNYYHHCNHEESNGKLLSVVIAK